MEKKRFFTDEEVYKIADFVTDYNDVNINEHVMYDKYGIDVEHLNTREAIDTYMNHLDSEEQIDVKSLWGEDLYKVFQNHIDEKGWLTCDWGVIIEREVPRLDEDYNDNPAYSETYAKMYLLDFEETQDGKFIRPASEEDQ